MGIGFFVLFVYKIGHNIKIRFVTRARSFCWHRRTTVAGNNGQCKLSSEIFAAKAVEILWYVKISLLIEGLPEI